MEDNGVQLNMPGPDISLSNSFEASERYSLIINNQTGHSSLEFFTDQHATDVRSLVPKMARQPLAAGRTAGGF